MNITKDLDERSRLILGYRLTGYTLDQIGDMCGISKETVRNQLLKIDGRIRRNVIKEVRPMIRKDAIEDYRRFHATR